MPHTREPSDVTEILTRQRIADAFTALVDPARGNADEALRLDEVERDLIRHALGASPHPLAGFATQLIDDWDRAELDDRVAGLLLFSEITGAQGAGKSRDFGRSPSPGLRR